MLGSKKPRVRLSNSSVAENATTGTTIGVLSVVNHTSGGSGWTFVIDSQTPSGKLAISSANLNTAAALDYETNPSLAVVGTASKSGQADLPFAFTINVTNVFEGVNLIALTLDDSSIPEDAGATINIIGAATGSAITVSSGSLPSGMTLNSGARTITGTPVSAATSDFTLRETLADSANSPHDTTLSIVVAAAGDETLDPDLYGPDYSLAVAQDEYPILLDIEIGVIPPTDYLELLVTSDLARTAMVINPAPVVIGAGDIVFPGLSTLDLVDAPLYLWIRRWNAALTQFGPWPDLPVKWGDTTAPTLSGAAGVQASDTTADLAVTSDEAEGTLYYAVLAAASAAPIAADFLAAATGGVATGSDTTPIAGTNSFAGITLPVASPVVADVTASGITDTTAVLTIAVTGGAGTLYWGVSTSATPPSLAALIAGAGMVDFGSGAAATGDTVLDVWGLSATTNYYAYAAFKVDTAYKVHAFQRDLAALDSNVASSSSFAMTAVSSVAGGDFTTAAPAAAPVWNPADKSSVIALSNGNRTALKSSGGVGAFGIRGVTGRDGTVARGFSVRADVTGSGNNIAIGVATAAQSLGNYPGGAPGATVVYDTGTIYPNGNTPVATGIAIDDGDVVTVLIKPGPDSSVQCWFLLNGTPMHGDPEAGTGYVTGPSGADIYPLFHAQATGQQTTFVPAVDLPAGFIHWEFNP